MTTLWHCDQVVFTFDGPDGRYAFVTCVGGGVGITRDGTPIPECRWAVDQVADCIEEFVRRTEAEC
ncbi:MAG TPA: hypothetical protein VGI81_03880 [Tepidisphaeraceae bacterium]|jgi:hypothetical protein